MIPHRAVITVSALLAMTFEVSVGQTADGVRTVPFPQPVALDISFEHSTFEACEPVIARVTLTNLGNQAFRVELRHDGTPLRVGLQVSEKGEPFRSRSLWLQRGAPQPMANDIALDPGESVAGESVVLLKYGRGYVFPTPGRYMVRWSWWPGRGYAKVYSDELRVTVLSPSEANDDFLTDLEDTGLRLLGRDRASIKSLGPEGHDAIRQLGANLLGKIISQQSPNLIDPERNPADKSEAQLVEALTELLDQHPDSSYSGYVARFLGLVHVKTFEHEISHRGAKTWGETKASPDHEEVTELCQSEYEKALRYLTIASQADLWPRTTAAFNLARLHGMAEEWAKVSDVCKKLRTDYAEQNGTALADKLESEMRRYREKIAGRKETD